MRVSKKLDEQLKLLKILGSESDERLTQHEEIWRNKTLNEIAKRIERAHLYFFNLPNYRNDLSKSQIDEWNTIFEGVDQRNRQALDDRVAALKSSSLENAHAALALFNVRSNMEFDIVRQYLMAHSIEELKKHDQLATLREIIESGAKYPRVRLGDYLRLNTDRINPSDFPGTRFRILGVSNTEGVFLNETKLGSELKQMYHRVKPNEFCYNPYRINVGSIGLCEFDYDNQIISGAYNVFGTDESELLPQYLMALFKSPRFLTYVNEKAHGGVRMNFKFEYLQEWKIPLPPFDTQRELANKLRSQAQVIQEAAAIEAGWRINIPVRADNCKRVPIRSLCKVRRGASPRPAGDPRYFGGDKYYWLKISDVPKDGKYTERAEEFVTEAGKDRSVLLRAGELILTNSGATLGYPSILRIDACVHDGFIWFENLSPEIDREFLYYVLKANREALFALAQTGTQPNLNTDLVGNFEIPLPSLDEQRQIVAELDRQMEALDSIRWLKGTAQKQVEDMIKAVWGEIT